MLRDHRIVTVSDFQRLEHVVWERVGRVNGMSLESSSSEGGFKAAVQARDRESFQLAEMFLSAYWAWMEVHADIAYSGTVGRLTSSQNSRLIATSNRREACRANLVALLDLREGVTHDQL